MGMEESKVIVNPFIFPSELSFYFILILITSFAPTLSLALSAARELFDLSSSLQYYFIALPLVTIFLLPVMTILLYRKGVESKIRKYGKNIVEKDYPDVSSLIFHLCQEIGVKAPTSFYTDDMMLNSFVFGYRKKAYMLISKDLCENFHLLPDLRETLIVHELSHLKNNDVVQHEVAEALSKSFAFVSFINIVCSLVISYPPSSGWLLLITFVYIIPCLTVFYFNNAIKRWREIYADFRTIIFQKSNKKIIALLRLLSSNSKSKLAIVFSPLILTPVKRIKIIEEEPMKHVVEKGIICAGLNVFSLSSILLSLATQWDIEDLLLPYFAIVAWFITSYYLIFIVVSPYWAILLKKGFHGLKELLVEAFVIPIKLSPIFTLSFLPFFLALISNPLSTLDWCFFFLLTNYLLLIIYQGFSRVTLSFFSLKINPAIKFNLPALIIFIFLSFPLTIAFLLQLLDYQFVLLVCIESIILSFVYMHFLKKYSKCPYCKRKPQYKRFFRIGNKKITLMINDYIKCPHCLHKLNEELFISINE